MLCRQLDLSTILHGVRRTDCIIECLSNAGALIRLRARAIFCHDNAIAVTRIFRPKYREAADSLCFTHWATLGVQNFNYEGTSRTSSGLSRELSQNDAGCGITLRDSVSILHSNWLAPLTS